MAYANGLTRLGNEKKVRDTLKSVIDALERAKKETDKMGMPMASQAILDAAHKAADAIQRTQEQR